MKNKKLFLMFTFMLLSLLTISFVSACDWENVPGIGDVCFCEDPVNCGAVSYMTSELKVQSCKEGSGATTEDIGRSCWAIVDDIRPPTGTCILREGGVPGCARVEDWGSVDINNLVYNAAKNDKGTTYMAWCESTGATPTAGAVVSACGCPDLNPPRGECVSGTCTSCGNIVWECSPDDPKDPDPYCGDGHKDPGEECDDGNNRNGDGCSSECKTEHPEPYCGDSICNDGPSKTCEPNGASKDMVCPSGVNLANGVCRTSGSYKCTYCGDGIKQSGAGEQCDDGNRISGDGCSSTCKIECQEPYCGDGIVNQASEQCDDGNNNNYDECRNNCKLPYCGDGIEDNGEFCDDGNNNNFDSCRNDCTLPYCGDGIKDPLEFCDDGNNVDGDGCSADCNIEYGCLTGYKWDEVSYPVSGWTIHIQNVDNPSIQFTDVTDGTGNYQFSGLKLGKWDVSEEMQDGWEVMPGYYESYEVTITLGECERQDFYNRQIPVCGDGNVDPGEFCDDGNTNNYDECRNDCTLPYCGDGIKDPLEFCDDGNNIDGDGCSADCNIEYGCVDGYKRDNNQVKLQGWTIHIKEESLPDSASITQITDQNGYYKFENLEFGTYDIWEEMQTGWEAVTAERTKVTVDGLSCEFVPFKNRKLCEDECDPEGFFCRDNELWECTDTDDDGCFEEVPLEDCSELGSTGTYEFCSQNSVWEQEVAEEGVCNAVLGQCDLIIIDIPPVLIEECDSSSSLVCEGSVSVYTEDIEICVEQGETASCEPGPYTDRYDCAQESGCFEFTVIDCVTCYDDHRCVGSWCEITGKEYIEYFCTEGACDSFTHEFVDIDGDYLHDNGCDDCIDVDKDGACDDVDNCLGLYNPRQVDTDNDGYGNQCDSDRDGDGYPASVDCDDWDAERHPGAEEIKNNGIDDDCNSETLDKGDYTPRQALYVDVQYDEELIEMGKDFIVVVQVKNTHREDIEDLQIMASLPGLQEKRARLVRQLESGESVSKIFSFEMPEHVDNNFEYLRISVSNNDYKRTIYREIKLPV